MARTPEPTRIVPPYGATISGTDHSLLSGLASDDHPQYHNDSRALSWLNTQVGTIVQAQDTALQDIADVAGQSNGDLFRWNGANWINYPDSNYSSSSHVHSHTALTNLAWTSSAHTGTINAIAGFDGTGVAAELLIGTDVQAWSTDLDTYAANPLTAAELGELQNIGATTISLTQWGYLGGMTTPPLEDGDIGSTVQAYDAALDVLSGLPFTANGEFLVGTGAGAAALESGDTARTSLGLGTGDTPSFTGVIASAGRVTLEAGWGNEWKYLGVQVATTWADTSGKFTIRGDSTIQMTPGLVNSAWFRVGGGMQLVESASAPSNVAGRGTFWVQNDVPNVAMFSDDAGTDHHLVLSAYHNEVTTADSTASAAKYSVFDDGNYGAYTSNENASRGITYSSTTGRFSFTNAGTYRISVSLSIDINTAADVTISAELSGVEKYTTDITVTSAGSPVNHAFEIILVVTAAQYVEVAVDSTTASLVICRAGCSIAISRV